MVTLSSKIPAGLYLHKYTSLDILHYWFKNKTPRIIFSRLDTFHDKWEGLHRFSSGELELLEMLVHVIRLLDEEEASYNIQGLFQQLKTIGWSNSTIPTDNMDNLQGFLKEFNQAIERKVNTHVSCFFSSDDPIQESRYMWNLYGKSSWPSVKLTFEWEKLKSALNSQDIPVTAGLVEYVDKDPRIDPLLTKDKSYDHEKEFRLYSSKLNKSKPYDEIVLPDDFPVQLIFNHVTPSSLGDMVMREIESLGFNITHDNSDARQARVSRLKKEEILDIDSLQSLISRLSEIS